MRFYSKKMQRRVKFIPAQKGGDSYVQDVFLTVPPNFHYWKGKCSEHRDALNWPFESEWSWRAFCPTWLCLSRHTDYSHLSFGTHNTSLCGQMGGCIWTYFLFDQCFYPHGPLHEDVHKECIWWWARGCTITWSKNQILRWVYFLKFCHLINDIRI